MNAADLEPGGFALVPGVLAPDRCEALRGRLHAVAGAGERRLLAHPEVAELARSETLLRHLRPHLAREPHPVRAILFDKTPAANWFVAWHQDLTVALQERVETPGFGPWSVKEGLPHVQPPVEMLAQMLTLRLHLDPADETNGALRVLPGTHRRGRLAPGDIAACRADGEEVVCRANTGDALLMRPLLLHASGRATSARHRRVLHLEYAGFDLPAGLRWNEAA